MDADVVVGVVDVLDDVTEVVGDVEVEVDEA